MKKYIILFILFIQTGLLFSQAPVITNVAFVQRTNGSLIVDITYDFTATGLCCITVVASDDGGSTWDMTCNNLTGHVGVDVSPGTGKAIVWDFYTDNPGQCGSNYKVRVTADDANLETGTMTGNDGKTYQTVKIGDQWWMSENLKETQYRDHSAITNVTDNAVWAALTTEAYCAYDNSETTANTYGYLYNWYAVDDSKNIAPAGWHVPTDAELTTLTTYLGGTGVAGGKMKELGTTHWNSPNTGATNESGFSGLPGGYRDHDNGTFGGLGGYAYFWSSTEYDSGDAWGRDLGYGYSEVYRYCGSKRHGFSVRLIRD